MREKKYKIIYYIICFIVGAFFPTIGFNILTWQWWFGCSLVWIAYWCGLNSK